MQNTPYENNDRDNSRNYDSGESHENYSDNNGRNDGDQSRNTEDEPRNAYENERNDDNNDESTSRDNVEKNEDDGNRDYNNDDFSGGNNGNSDDEREEDDEFDGKSQEAGIGRSKNSAPEMLKWNHDGKHAYGTVGHHKMPKAQKILDEMLHEDKFLDGSSIRKFRIF